MSGESRLFTADLYLKREEALVLLFPLGNDRMRPAYVHKAAGSPVRGSFSFGNASVALPQDSSPALGAVDWTRSLALRCTRWNWASSSFRGRVTTLKGIDDDDSTDAARDRATGDETASVGINFSKDVYDIDGESQENAVWINGRVFALRGVVFTVPVDPVREEWAIRSMEGLCVTDTCSSVRNIVDTYLTLCFVCMTLCRSHEFVNLTFTPQGSREDHTKLLVMESDFIQPYGTFNGHIQFVTEEGSIVQVHVNNAFGVVEKHLAIW